ncbi:DUF1217 domain-containing protein [Ancylobacter lacus]|uniref:DUF1217 domain-containing protein n=1 Tax=Ancylobacter lacus TaxID=2579970 RepID=UPI001BCD9FDD|nr:DUF1217 domain-containing protein [Ancylobacter lacus]MBS7537953.1 DUF1217 domain-containing protein [Ancylobacter lacus]
MDTTFASYQSLSRDLARTLKLKSAEPSVALETKFYKANIGQIKSIDDFLKNTRVFTYAMKAFGLEDMAFAKGYMRKVLQGGVTDSSSFANRLNDDRFVAFAKAFDFKQYGALTTSRTEAVTPVVDKYVRQSLETDLGAENQGLRLALYFKREAPNVKSAYGLLGDAALWKVVKTLYDFPDAMANADIAKQASAVKARLNVADLKDPVKLDRLISRFTAKWDAANGIADSSVTSLFARNNTRLDIGMTLISLKYGG